MEMKTYDQLELALYSIKWTILDSSVAQQTE